MQFEQAKAYALDRLSKELPPNFFYHSIHHTRDDVLPNAERLALANGIGGESLVLLRTAALYHDLGYLVGRVDHELSSIKIAREMLPQYGYTQVQIDVITGIIMATKLPQSPKTLLEQIMADADLDSLGRDDFFETGGRLRAEMEAYGAHFTDQSWYESQLAFVGGHNYFTPAEHALRDAQKQKNLEEIKHRLGRK